MRKISLLLLATTCFLNACKSNIKPAKPDPGEADFGTYIAIGNSLTAGYSDNSLYRSGQQNSYPSMLAKQFKLVGGGAFSQPLLPGNAGWPEAKLILAQVKDCEGNTVLRPVSFDGSFDTAGSSANISAQGPYNNLGIPGIRCIDFSFPFYGALNPYAARIFNHPSNENPIDFILKKTPTFFSVWLGSNDVLGYATGGGEGSVSGLLPDDISPLSLFQSTYDSIIAKLVRTGAKGVLINIPDLTVIPFFTTINPKGLILTSGDAEQLDALYASSGITFSEGANYYVIEDDHAPGGARKMKAGEYLLLNIPMDALQCGGWGRNTPIPKQYVLTADEVATIQDATGQFNDIISAAAQRYGLALMDANAYLQSLQPGLSWDGLHYTPEFVTGGLFSLDGIHLTPRGYALVANEILRVINEQYHASVPLVEVNQYSGVKFP